MIRADVQSYLAYLKGYMKAVKAHLQENQPDRVEAFEKGAQAFAKKIIGNFKDYEFYVGESMNPDGMVALLNYREDGTTPYVSFGPGPPPPSPPLTHSTIRPPSSTVLLSFPVLTLRSVHLLEGRP